MITDLSNCNANVKFNKTWLSCLREYYPAFNTGKYNVINAKQLQFALSKLAFVTMLKKIHFTAVSYQTESIQFIFTGYKRIHLAPMH